MAEPTTVNQETLEQQLLSTALYLQSLSAEFIEANPSSDLLGLRATNRVNLSNNTITFRITLPIELELATDGGLNLLAKEVIGVEPVTPLVPDYSIFTAADFIAGVDLGDAANAPQGTIDGQLDTAPFSAGAVSDLTSTKGNVYSASGPGEARFVGTSLRTTTGNEDLKSDTDITVTADEMYAIVVGIDDFSRVQKEINLMYQLAGHQPKVLKNGNLLARYQRPNQQQIAEEVALTWLPNQPNVFVLNVRGNEIDYCVNGELIHTLRPGAVTLGEKRHDIYLKEADLLFQGTWTSDNKPSPRLAYETLKDAFSSASFT